MKTLSYETVSTLVTEREGKLYWLTPKGRVRKGDEAGCHSRKHGYIAVFLKGRLYLAHRVVWMLNKKHWPRGEVKHISGDKQDNRLENLMVLTHSSVQRRNRTPKSNKTSRVRGVTYHKLLDKWQAQMKVNGKYVYLGQYDYLVGAVRARHRGEVSYMWPDAYTTSPAFVYLQKNDRVVANI